MLRSDWRHAAVMVLAIVVAVAASSPTTIGSADDESKHTTKKTQARGLGGVPFPETVAEYRMPVPIPCMISQGHRGRLSHSDEYNRFAWDFAVSVGTPVLAARSGVVHRVRDFSYTGGADRKWLDFANEVLIDHLDGTFALYLHLSPSIPVNEGDYVVQGEEIAHSGGTGYAHVPHLHYTLCDAQGISLDSKFVDFTTKGGVPAEGDAVRPGRPPEVPQEAIEVYRAAWRACAAAERLGAPELALDFAQRGLKKARSTKGRKSRQSRGTSGRRKIKPNYKEYYYDRLLAARVAANRQLLTDRAAELLAYEKPADTTILEIEQLRAALSKSRDASLKGLVRSLERMRKLYGEEVAKEWKRAERALETFDSALRAECTGEFSHAVDHYVKALETAHKPTLTATQASLGRFASERNGVVLRRLRALATELGGSRGEPKEEQRARIQRDVDSLWPTHNLLLDLWEKKVPDSGLEPVEARARLEKLVRQIREKAK